MKSVLSIQSAVTFGAVGNTMASAVMATLRHHLARVDTVQLVAHPGHGRRAGGTIPAADFDMMLDSIFALAFDRSIDAVMTGYMGTPHQVDKVADMITALVHADTGLDVLIDPAIGDHGRLYVDPTIADRIVHKLIPHASVITPNAFELAHLTGRAFRDSDAIRDASHELMAHNPRLCGIAVTGWHDESSNTITDCWIDGDDMITYGASQEQSNQGPANQGQANTSSKGMAGGGDLFAAILMGMRLDGCDWRDAFQKTAPLCRQIINSAEVTGAIDIDIAIIRDTLCGIID